MSRIELTAIIILGLTVPTLKGPLPEDDFDYGDQFVESLTEELNQTSSGLASGAATPDGRPLLWKSRDKTGTTPVEFHYYDDGRIPFISVTDRGSTTTYYGGINALGFALENTDMHNLSIHGPHNDGRVILDALAQCRTVDDLAGLLDSADQVDVDGRWGYNYGCIDAYGGATIYEAYRFGHARFDAIDEPDGILTRANFGYNGDIDPNSDPLQYGPHRHNRAKQLLRSARANGILTAQYIMQTIVRDLTSDNFNPYPLPFQGYSGDLPYGCIDNSKAICRKTTTAVMIAQGVRAGERPDNAILWSMNGSPVAGIATPLWVRAGSTPVEYDGRDSSRINNRIIKLYHYIYATFPNSVDTWKLTNPDGTGLWDYLIPLEQTIFTKTEQFLRSPQFNVDRLRGFQNEMAQQITDSLERWRPTYAVTEIVHPVFGQGYISLGWGVPDLEGLFDDDIPRCYDIRRSENPFREGESGELVGTVNEPEFTDTDPLPAGGYYKIIARY